MLGRAFDTLSAAYNEHGNSFEYGIRGNLVHIHTTTISVQKNIDERIQKTIAAYYRPCRAWAIAGSLIAKLADHDIASPYKMPQPRNENDNPHTALLAIIVYISEELFALRERWRGNALSALARIDRVKQNILDALSRNL